MDKVMIYAETFSFGRVDRTIQAGGPAGTKTVKSNSVQVDIASKKSLFWFIRLGALFSSFHGLTELSGD